MRRVTAAQGPLAVTKVDGRRRVSLLLHTFSRGGSDRVAAYLARGFADAGLDVDLVVFSRGGEIEATLLEIVGDDVPIQYLGDAGGPRFWDMARKLPKLVALLRARAPDAVVSTANHTTFFSALALWLARLDQCRLLMKTTNPVAGSRHTGLNKHLRLLSYRIAFRRAALVLTLSVQESVQMRAAFPRSAALFRDVANPYILPAMLAAPPASPKPARKTILCLARLTAQKRVDRLIAAFARVQHPNVDLKILGEGEEREALTAQIAQLGLQARVSMPGYVTAVASALHQADLFVLTSDYEGLPAAVLEALATNCPVLSTDCFPAARSLLQDAEGCAIIENTDALHLAKLIDAHLVGPRPKGLKAVAERYTVANGIAEHLLALRDCGISGLPAC